MSTLRDWWLPPMDAAARLKLDPASPEAARFRAIERSMRRMRYAEIALAPVVVAVLAWAVTA